MNGLRRNQDASVPDLCIQIVPASAAVASSAVGIPQTICSIERTKTIFLRYKEPSRQQRGEEEEEKKKKNNNSNSNRNNGKRRAMLRRKKKPSFQIEEEITEEVEVSEEEEEKEEDLECGANEEMEEESTAASDMSTNDGVGEEKACSGAKCVAGSPDTTARVDEESEPNLDTNLGS